MPIFKRLLRYALVLALAGIVLAVAAFGVAYWLISPRLPPVKSLKNVQMQVPLRVYSADGKLMASFGEMHRTPVDIRNVPPRLKDAVLAAEDADFYHHGGVDWEGTFRAAVHVILAGGKKVQGGSTITQQVARNFFLSPQKSYTRKLEEMFLSFRIENALTKDQILQLYLNKMFMGHRAYGVAAAAQYYYGKTLDQLTVAQCAMLGGLYQAPSAANPVSNPKRALRRRNYVLRQMRDNNFINQAQFKQAIAEPVTASPHEPPVKVHAPYVAEMVRQAALERLGNAALSDGYVIHTTIDSRDQAAAEHALRWGLQEYDHRHGYRGPEAHVQLPPQAGAADFDKALSGHDSVAGIQPGLVTQSGADTATVYLKNGKDITLDMDAVKWARPYVNATYPGKAPKSVDGVVKRGDIIRVMHEQTKKDAKDAKEGNNGKDNGGREKAAWTLAQIPAVNGALVSLRPDDGAVRALVGGFSFQRSKFNRALMTGSGRQPGSSFKPYLYTAALNHGFTNASIINDAPVVLPDPSKPGGRWTPQNDDGKFDGPIRLRTALIESKNLVSVRLLDAIGLRYARHYITRFGFSLDQLPNNLTMALGTASVSPMSMARGYAIFANGGFRVDPYFISQIDNRDGQALYKADPLRACRNCQPRQLQDPKQLDLNTDAPPAAAASAADPLALNSVLQPVAASRSAGAEAPAAATSAEAQPRLAPRVITPRNEFLITSLLKGVIRHGTGHAAMALGRDDLAGKTGTTNDQRDAWFDGFNANMLTIVWVGFDDFGTLGHHEFGATAALPIWMKYMGTVLKDKAPATLPMPPGITQILINKNTGLPTNSADPDAMQEYFKVENVDKLRQAAQQRKQDKAQQNAYDIF